MTVAARLGQWPATLALALAAVAVGMLIGRQPALAVAAVGVGAVLALAFLAPVAHLTALVAVTAIVPYGFQNSVVGTGAGLIVSDVLLLTGLARALIAIARQPLPPRRLGVVALLSALLTVAGLQAIRAVDAGTSLSTTGYELRSLLGWGAALIVAPIVVDPAARMRLFKALAGVGIAVGAWGIFQYFGYVPFSEGQAGLRPGVRFTTEGKGQVQGGLFAFPIVVVVGLAILILTRIRPLAARVALIVMVVLNAVALLLTYERTLWLATIVAMGLVALRAGWSQRIKALGLVCAVAVIVVPLISTIAPGALVAARERLLSLGQYRSDSSLRARVVEARAVLAKIEAHPLIGSGLGDEIHWGMPWLEVPPTSQSFAHNDYLWLSWKLGIPATLALVSLLIWAMLARPPPGLDRLSRDLVTGAQAALLASMIISLTFPGLRALAISTTLGVLVGICLLTRGSARRDRDPAP
jgi:general stress protein CsbA